MLYNIHIPVHQMSLLSSLQLQDFQCRLTVIFVTDFHSESADTCGGCADPLCSDSIPGCNNDGLYSGVWPSGMNKVAYKHLFQTKKHCQLHD